MGGGGGGRRGRYDGDQSFKWRLHTAFLLLARQANLERFVAFPALGLGWSFLGPQGYVSEFGSSENSLARAEAGSAKPASHDFLISGIVMKYGS